MPFTRGSGFKNVIRGSVMSNLQRSHHQTGVEVDTSALQTVVQSSGNLMWESTSETQNELYFPDAYEICFGICYVCVLQIYRQMDRQGLNPFKKKKKGLPSSDIFYRA